MSLFLVALLTGLVLIVAGALLIWNGSPIGAMARAFPRSRRAAWVTMGLGSAWTLYYVTQLGEADFGNHKELIFGGFVIVAALAFRYVTDFLSVRGACILALLTADVMLTSSYMKHGQPPHLVLNVLAYVMILLALYLAVSPFRARDFFQWLFQRPQRARIFGAIVGAYGLLLLGTALTLA